MKSPMIVIIALLMCAIELFLANRASATQFDVVGPPGSGDFGGEVVALPNGNFVVIDPYYSSYPTTPSSAGRVCLYDGSTFALIDTMIGTADFDLIGNGGVTVLANGDYVVTSYLWSHFRGAVTRCSATTGCPPFVSAENSLVGSISRDEVGLTGVAALPNGNYVVRSVSWNSFRGAITWCDGNLGCTGEVSPANSRVGASPSDRIGDSDDMIVLANGNFVSESLFWDNGSARDAGAVTFCKGNEPCTGAVSIANSLVGTQTQQFVGNSHTTIPLTNGNYVVRTTLPAHGTSVGAVTFCNGISGCHEPVSRANSLFPSLQSSYPDLGIAALPSGDYVVASSSWDSDSAADVGAATFCNGMTGCAGLISTANSLVGSTAGDNVGRGSIIALTNGGYVVNSPYWDNRAASEIDVGASTFCAEANGCTGVVSAANSLIGATPYDYVGNSAVAMANGNYVVVSPQWNNNTVSAAAAAGAVTFCSGETGCVGKVSSINSLVGSSTNDNVGTVAALSNGNYVVTSVGWNHGSIEDVGAATFCNGTSGCTGTVSPANSLIGSTAGDRIGGERFNPSIPDALVAALPLVGGNYVVVSPHWHNGTAIDAGALTTCSGTVGCTGIVSAANSLVGTTANDHLGAGYYYPNYYGEVTALPNGDYVLRSINWHNMGVVTGAVTYGFGNGGTVGPIRRVNSVLDTGRASFSFDPTRNRLLVGRPDRHSVTVFTPDNIPEPISAVSRKVHGAAGTFDIDVLHSEIECRNTGAGGSYQVIVTFPDPVSVGGVSVTSSDENATATQNTNGAVVTVDLSMVANAQTLRITLVKVNDGVGSGDVVIPFKVLTSDVFGGDAYVTTFDLSQTTMALGQPVNGSNFRSDVNANGLINATDVSLVRSKLGTHLP